MNSRLAASSPLTSTQLSSPTQSNLSQSGSAKQLSLSMSTQFIQDVEDNQKKPLKKTEQNAQLIKQRLARLNRQLAETSDPGTHDRLLIEIDRQMQLLYYQFRKKAQEQQHNIDVIESEYKLRR